MNRRIRKKKQKLVAMHASKYKYAKLGKKRAHAVYIQSRHCMWGLIPHKDNYAIYLRRKRRHYGEIKSGLLLARSCVMMCQAERKEVKEKLIVKEGNCDFERKPLPDEFVRGR